MAGEPAEGHPEAVLAGRAADPALGEHRGALVPGALHGGTRVRHGGAHGGRDVGRRRRTRLGHDDVAVAQLDRLAPALDRERGPERDRGAEGDLCGLAYEARGHAARAAAVRGRRGAVEAGVDRDPVRGGGPEGGHHATASGP